MSVMVACPATDEAASADAATVSDALVAGEDTSEPTGLADTEAEVHSADDPWTSDAGPQDATSADAAVDAPAVDAPAVDDAAVDDAAVDDVGGDDITFFEGVFVEDAALDDAAVEAAGVDDAAVEDAAAADVSVDEGAVDDVAIADISDDTGTANDVAETSAPVADACVSEADEAKISSEVFYSALQTCPVTCTEAPAYEACSTDCYIAEGGVSADCAGCYAQAGQCAADTGCAAICIVNPAGPDCHTCLMGSGCLDAFQQCSGRTALIGPGPSAEGCDNPADAAAHESSDVSGAALQCSLSCQAADDTIENCTSTCVSAAAGLTEGCGDCYGESMACVIQWCSTPCAADPTSAMCSGCMVEGGCANAFEQCAGIAFTPPQSAP